MDVSRHILVLGTSIFMHFCDKYFRTEGVYVYILSSWVQLQLQNHPAKFWEDGIKDYITHAFEIMVFYLCFILKSIVHCQVHEAKRSLLDYFFTELGATKESYVLIFLKKLEVQDNDLLYMFVVMPYFLGIWI
ncbi:hypothetical protein VPH35_110919 [Triticum aestivum]